MPSGSGEDAGRDIVLAHLALALGYPSVCRLRLRNTHPQLRDALITCLSGRAGGAEPLPPLRPSIGLRGKLQKLRNTAGVERESCDLGVSGASFRGGLRERLIELRDLLVDIGRARRSRRSASSRSLRAASASS